MGGQQGQTVESTRATAVSILVFSSLLHHKKSRMEEHETHITLPPHPIYKYFQHGKQTLIRKHFLKKAAVENLHYAIGHNLNAAQKGSKLRSHGQLHSLLNHMLIAFF